MFKKTRDKIKKFTNEYRDEIILGCGIVLGVGIGAKGYQMIVLGDDLFLKVNDQTWDELMVQGVGARWEIPCATGGHDHVHEIVAFSADALREIAAKAKENAS